MDESVIISNVFHHVAWGTTIAVYFWLVGASAGSFVISSFGWVFGIKRYKPLALTASVTAIIMLMMVPILLIWDLGKPLRFVVPDAAQLLACHRPHVLGLGIDHDLPDRDGHLQLLRRKK